ncbi:MAG: protein kinase [Acidobacteria bacterium]|nr:protein kinase [Acidobacteriota bacterium]
MRYIILTTAILMLTISLLLFLFSVTRMVEVPLLSSLVTQVHTELADSSFSFISWWLWQAEKVLHPFFLLLISGVFIGINIYIIHSSLHNRRPPRFEPDIEQRADWLFQQGRYKRALKLYDKAERWDMVAQIYLKIRQYAKAAQMLEKLGDEHFVTAAEVYEQVGNLVRARRCYVAAGYYFRDKHSWEKAATNFIKGNRKDEALDCYERQFKDMEKLSTPDQWKSRSKRIIALAEQLGDPLKAARYAEYAREIEDAVHYYTRGGNLIKAAELLLNQQKLEAALDILVRIKKGEPNYVESLVLKARIFRQQQKYAEAIRHYLDFFKSEKLGNANLEDFFYLGDCLEKLGKLDQARDIFQKINVKRPYFMNADVRIEAIDRKKQEAGEMTQLLEKDMAAKLRNQDGPFKTGIGERYDELEELGRGGAGIVFRARDKLLDRTVALKLLPAHVTTDTTRLKSFFKEAKAIAKLNHPNIVSIYDILKVENEYYIVMEFIKGITIESMLEARRRIPSKLALFVARYVLLALSYAHRSHVIHQDIKPANIMLSDDRTVKLMDFGVAQLRDELPDHSSSIVVGTPKYISPEQLQGIPVDERCDIYSFGVTLYEMISGALPYPSEGILRHHLMTPPTPMRTHIRNYPTELENVISRCLEKDREKRYRTAREVYDDLKAIAMRLQGNSRKKE